MSKAPLASARGSEPSPNCDGQGAVVNRPHRRSGESGFALLLVFLMAAAISISLYYEIPRVAFQSQRQKEQLLMERGEQYKRAIQLFVRANGRYPGKPEDLENFNNRRFLRHKFTDPITGKAEWRIIHVNAAGVFYDSVLNKKKTDDKQQTSTGPQFVAEEPALGSNLNTGQPAVNPGLRRRGSEGGQPTPTFGPDGQPIQYANGVAAIPGQPNQPYQPAPGMPGVANPGGLPTNVVPVLPGAQPSDQQTQAFPGAPGTQPNPGFPFNGGINNSVASNAGTPVPPELNNLGGGRFGNPAAGAPPGFNQTVANQTGFNQPGFNQPGLNQPGFNQPGATPGFNPTGTQTPGFGQTGFNQPGFNQPGINQPGFNQPGFNQPNVNQAGNNQGSSFVGGGGSFVGGSSFVGGGGSFVGGSAAPATGNSVATNPGFPQPIQPPIPQPNQPFPQGNQPFPQANQGFPQPNQPFPQANQPFPTPQTAQTAGTPISSGGANAATDMIGRILTSPRPGGAPDGVQQANGTTIGGGIAGVASLSENPAIMVYHDRTNYNEWEFLFDLTKQRQLANPAGGVVGTPAQAIGNVAGSPGFAGPAAAPGLGAAQPAGFGAAPQAGFGAALTAGPGGPGGAFPGGPQPQMGAGAGLQSANPGQNAGPGQTAGAAQNGQLGQGSGIPADIRLGRP